MVAKRFLFISKFKDFSWNVVFWKLLTTNVLTNVKFTECNPHKISQDKFKINSHKNPNIPTWHAKSQDLGKEVKEWHHWLSYRFIAGREQWNRHAMIADDNPVNQKTNFSSCRGCRTLCLLAIRKQSFWLVSNQSENDPQQ